jgi:hypothetical protein
MGISKISPVILNYILPNKLSELERSLVKGHFYFLYFLNLIIYAKMNQWRPHKSK